MLCARPPLQDIAQQIFHRSGVCPGKALNSRYSVTFELPTYSGVGPFRRGVALVQSVMNNPKHSGFWSCGQEKMIFFDLTEIAGCCADLNTALRPLFGIYGPHGAITTNHL